MPFVDTSSLDVIERLPGWYGRYFHSASMTFAHYDFKRGSSIHEHSHPQEEKKENLAPRARFELATLRLTAEAAKKLTALSGVAYSKSGAIFPSLAAPNVAPKI